MKATPTFTALYDPCLFFFVPLKRISPDVCLLSDAAGLGDGSEAPPLPHCAHHLGIQPPHEDATVAAKTVNSLTLGSETYNQVSVRRHQGSPVSRHGDEVSAVLAEPHTGDNL